MNAKSNSLAPSRYILFTVCADPDTVARVIDGCAYVAETEFAGEFHDYISRNKRPQFSQRVKDSTTCIAVIDFDRDTEQAAVTAQILQQMFVGRIATVAVSERSEPELLLRAMRAGCCEFLSQPFDSAGFAEMVERLQLRFATVAAAEVPKNAGNVISLFGAKGGVGTTTLAVYLATSLAAEHHKKVLLVDHHHQLGHVCLYLGIKENPYYFDELLRNVDRLDAELLAGFLTHHPNGLDLLPSPYTCATRFGSNSRDMEQVLEFLRGEYDYVILDSSLEYQDVNSAIVDSSNQVYLVATPDVAALRDLSRHVENFGLDVTAAYKVRIVLNRSSSHDAVTKEQVEAAVRFPVSVSIPNNYAELIRAINAGEPLHHKRRSEFTAQIGKWSARLVHADPETEAPKRRSLAFWK